tara:strand:- start:52 stop:327 length:276 start_codon:yes stop_codon:yes gene_type:complete
MKLKLVSDIFTGTSKQYSFLYEILTTTEQVLNAISSGEITLDSYTKLDNLEEIGIDIREPRKSEFGNVIGLEMVHYEREDKYGYFFLIILE